MEELKYDLTPMWKALLDIYDEFDRICRRHNLRYYLAYGTAIGVLRHGGFIPWDDDFDVVMPRPDYERLIEIAPKELPSNLKLLSRKLDKTYLAVFNKVQVDDPGLVERIQRESKLSLYQGLYIDIFPIDGAPRSKIGQKLYWTKRRCLRSIGVYLKYRNGKVSMKELPLVALGWLTHWFYPSVKDPDSVNDTIEKWASTYRYDDAGWTTNCQGDLPICFPPGSLGEPAIMDFTCCGTVRKVPMMAKADELLTLRYGNWRQPPPPEKCIPSHQIRGLRLKW